MAHQYIRKFRDAAEKKVRCGPNADEASVGPDAPLALVERKVSVMEPTTVPFSGDRKAVVMLPLGATDADIEKIRRVLAAYKSEN